MAAVIALFIIVIVSITIVKTGAVALELTGISHEVASFQAQSAFSGVGFTTTESEAIVKHPVRRRIIRFLFLVGSAGITSSMATLVLAFAGQTRNEILYHVGVLISGLLVIVLVFRSSQVNHLMRTVITWMLQRWSNIQIYDFEEMLGFDKGYTISRFKVKEGSWLSNRKLSSLNIKKEGILILAMYRIVDGKEIFISELQGENVIHEGDILVCYSRHNIGKALAEREKGREGDKEHKETVVQEQHLARIREIKERAVIDSGQAASRTEPDGFLCNGPYQK